MDTQTEDANTSADNDSFAPEYRDRLRTWLVKMINSKDIAGLFWENEEKTIFRMPWKHAGRQDYNLEEDSKIFMAWAKHSGRYREGIDKPEPIVWKTRLRCALNKMPDIRELPERSRLDISEPYRVYQLLPPVHKASQIRRRLYKRSQSHDADHVRSCTDHVRPLPLLTSPERESELWAEKTNLPRRSSSMEAAQLSLPPRTSPLNSAPPGIWFPPSVNVPLETSMSAAMPSLSLSHTASLTMNAVNPLGTLAHSQFPLVSSLHSPFVSLPATSVSPLFVSGHAGLAAFKQLGLAPQTPSDEHVKRMTLQAIAAKQGYQDQLAATFSKTLEGHVRTQPDGKELPQPDENILCQKMANMDTIPLQGALHLRKNTFNQSHEPSRPKDTFNSMRPTLGHVTPENVSQLHRVHVELFELQRKIEVLEKDLSASRTAHAQEREARKKLESEYQNMNVLLQSTGKRFAISGLSDQSQDVRANLWKNIAADERCAEMQSKVRQHLEENAPSKTKLSSSYENSFKIQSLLSSTDRRSSNDTIAVMRRSPGVMQKKQDPNTDSGHEIQRKRSSLPLDLTVHSPTKIQRLSCNEEMFPSKSSSMSFCVNPSFVTSSSPRSGSCDDKRGISSPFSASSELSDPCSVRGATTSENRARSMSPLQRTSSLLQPRQGQGTIQVA